jgi:hypothetical protein
MILDLSHPWLGPGCLLCRLFFGIGGRYSAQNDLSAFHVDLDVFGSP